jgi:ABC-type sugar transport system ATPase subunit
MNPNLLELRGLTVSYRGPTSDRWRLDVPEFTLHASEVHVVSGDNMSGKTTFLRLIAGMASDFLVDDARSGGNGYDSRALADRTIILSSDDAMFPELSILENIELGVPADEFVDEHVAAAHRLLADAGVFKSRSLGTPLAALSSGGRAIVKFCRATVSRRPLVLLDEISSYLDVERSELVLRSAVEFAQCGRAVVIVSHSERDRRFIAERYPVRYTHISRHLDRSVVEPLDQARD